MVNRILIRIKVIQMLYAYLLTRTEFKVDSNTDVSSADKKFANKVYVDLLALILELTGNSSKEQSNKTFISLNKKLLSSSVAEALARNTTVKELILKNHEEIPDFQPLLQGLHDAIIQSSVFCDYKRRRKTDLEDEIKLWRVLFETTISHYEPLIRLFKAMPGYSAAGLEMALVRIVETLDSYYGAKAGYYQALKSLETSLLQAHKLYISIFVLIIRLTEARYTQIENAKAKYLATSEDMNPNMKFVNNLLAKALSEDKLLQKYIKDYQIQWTDDITLLNSLLNLIQESAIYHEYMNSDVQDWEKDCEFWRQIFKSVIFPSDDLTEALEGVSVYWNDDLHIIGTFVLKSLRVDALNPEGEIEFLPQYKDEEDGRFGAELFEYAVKNRREYLNFVDMYLDSSNWESDRIAFMDSVIMICALAEIINFPNIPLAVSMNEYIEIANMYSSPKSGQFINGILFNIIEHLKSEGIIAKA